MNRQNAKLAAMYDGTLRLNRRIPSEPSDLDLLVAKASEAPLIESVRRVTVEGMSEGFAPHNFSVRPPPPLSLPAWAFAAAPSPDDVLSDPLMWAPSHVLHLDACAVVGGYERTDFSVAANMLARGLQPPLVPWMLQAVPCVRINLCPGVYGHRSEGPSSKAKVEGQLDPTLLALEAHDVVRDAMRHGQPLESVEFTVGFSDGQSTVANLLRQSHDRDRHHIRPAFGFSLPLLQARLAPVVWTLARVLHGHFRLTLGAVSPPPTFWLSCVGWFIASHRGDRAALKSLALPDTHGDIQVDDEALDWAARSGELKADVAAVCSYLAEACRSEARPISASDTSTFDRMSSADMITLLRVRSQQLRRRQRLTDGEDSGNNKVASSKPHYVWRNFYLPAEDFTGIATVSHFRDWMHSRARAATAVDWMLSSDDMDRALHYQIPSSDTPHLYFAPVRLR